MNRPVLVGLFVGAVGCAGSEMTLQEMQERQIRSALIAQQAQTRMIPDPQARATAMRQLALSAAFGNDAKTAEGVLDDLKGHPSHDEVAAECATQFARAEKPREARRVAKRIEDETLRTATLARIEEKPDGKDGKKGEKATAN